MQKNKATAYGKTVLLKCKKYAPSRDILAAILADDKEYTTEEVAKLIAAFNQREVI